MNGEQKKGMSGCMLVLLLLGGCFLLLMIVGGAFLWKVSRSPEGRRILEGIGEGKRAMEEGQKAPGMDEVRMLGCSSAVAFEYGDFAKVASRFGVDAGPKDPDRMPLMVVCSPGLRGEAPSCHDIARTYVAAVGGRAKKFFAVQVNETAFGGKARCMEQYDADGTPRGAIKH